MNEVKFMVRTTLCCFLLLVLLLGGIAVYFFFGMGSGNKNAAPVAGITKEERTAASGTDGDYDYKIYKYEDKEHNVLQAITLVRYNGKDKDITIPAKIKDIEVKKIGNACFGQQDIESVKFSPLIEEIDSYAFYRCEKLKEVVFLDGLKKIGDFAFRDCTALTEISFPDSIEVIDMGAFFDCRALETIDFKTRKDFEIGEYAFRGTGVKTVILPSNLQKLGRGAFAECYSLKALLNNSKVEIEKDVTSVTRNKNYYYSSSTKKKTTQKSTSKTSRNESETTVLSSVEDTLVTTTLDQTETSTDISQTQESTTQVSEETTRRGRHWSVFDLFDIHY